MSAALAYTDPAVGMAWRDGKALSQVQTYLDVESSDSDASSEALEGHHAPRRWLWAGTAAVGLALACLLCLWLSTPLLSGPALHAGGAARSEADVAFGEKVLVSGEPSATPTSAPMPGARPGATAPATGPTVRTEVAAPPGPASASLVPNASASEALVPVEHLHDGNVCGDDEELFAGLCYRKCSLLTGGQDPIRTSPWTCCKSRPCFVNQRGSIGRHVACAGYDVSGDGSCPHKPGACLRDEELFLGVCYKKCSLLTDQEYNHRVAPETCCEDSGLGCLDFRKDWTSKEFAVGGAQAGPGACQEDEEMLLSTCYKKCALLTNNEYPHRVAAATCCKAGSRLPHRLGGVWHLGCLDFWKDKTSPAFNVPGDGPHEAKVPGQRAHLPLKSLTEAQAARDERALHA